MGYDRWDTADYASTSATYKTQTRSQLFSSQEAKPEFRPENIEVRESRDSKAHPESNAIILGVDVSGSMGYLAESIAKEGLGTFVNNIHDESPVSDPHVLLSAIGDACASDRYPFQATQFEADIRIAEQLTELHLEGRGGGNTFESYDLPWLFAATKTAIDCFEKRNKKGYLFTMGDEKFPTAPSESKLVSMGFKTQMTTSRQFLEAAQEKYDVFHLIIEEGDYCRRNLNAVMSDWTGVLGRRAIPVVNHKHIPEILVSIMRVNEGEDVDDVIEFWQESNVRTSVNHALNYNMSQV